jgi:hypothetical protein
MCSKKLVSPLGSASAAPCSNEGPDTPRWRHLRPYQKEVGVAVLDSVFRRKGLTFSVEIARQGGKNELSAQLEVLLLTLHIFQSANLIKCSPTFKPQALISMTRLEDRLNEIGFAGLWAAEHSHIVRLGNARAVFLSADASANVVGNTAHILMEVDESQDVDVTKYTKDFKPMCATTNCTCVHYGTTWNDNTLLEEVKHTNLELEKKDGIKRHFRYDWQEVAKYNPDYLNFVEGERQRLGENHPLFRTQYCLLPLRGGGGLFSSVQKAQLQGSHSRVRAAEKGKIYVAGIDLAGEAEEVEDAFLHHAQPKRDSTVITIGELDFSAVNTVQPQPGIKIVEHYTWTGSKHTDLYIEMIDILKSVWGCKRIVVDATGVGQPVASFLAETLGSRVVPYTFTAPSKSALGFKLLAAVNSGRLKMYAADNSPEYQEFWTEIEKAQSHYRPNQTMNFFVDAAKGHDDFLMSLALVLEAAENYAPRSAKGSS